ncbi:MAG: hypothetical protein HYR84_16400 [Planctomycetes bacterium]|nr:hypothetical protein [Planctomycetota bacterium]
MILVLRRAVTPQSLNVVGATQPDIYIGTIDDIAALLSSDSAKYWQETLKDDGPIAVWPINGERWLSNGNHRYQAALRLGIEIPDSHVTFEDLANKAIPTWRFDQMTWFPGRK